MATFSVDITSVKLAGANTGYKDITISGMPQAGVSCTITGTDTSAFGYRIPGDDPNVYRVYSTSHSNLGVSRPAKTATFRITNAGDSSDYVDVSLVQVQYSGYPSIQGTESSNSDEVYVSTYGECFFAYSLSLYTLATIYIDGYEGTATASDSWIYYSSQSSYTDTGFKIVTVGCNNNYNGPQKGNLTINGTKDNATVLVYQNGYPSSTSGCTSPINFTDSGGTETVTLKCESGFNPANISYFGVNTSSFSSFSITKGTSTSTSLLWSITVGANSGDEIIGVVVFERSSISQYYGHTIIKQAAPVPAPTLVASPSELTYPATGGAGVLDVDYDTTLTTNLSSVPSWLSAVYVDVGSSQREYTITAASNETSVARSWDLELSDVNMSLTVPIIQEPASSLSVSPTENSVTSASGSVQITVNAVGISSVSYSASAWITYTGKSGDVYTFSYTENTGSSQRQGVVTFSGGGLSATYTLTQAASDQPSLVVSPTTKSVSSSSGTVQVTVTATNISTVTYRISDSWISYISESSGGVYTFSYTANTGAQRQGTVTFSGGGLSKTFTLTQAAGAISVSPASSTVNSSSGTVQVTVTGPSNITYSISGSWLTYQSKSGDVYTFAYTQNSASSQRTATVTFSASGVADVTYSITQAGSGEAPIISVSPTEMYFSLAQDVPNSQDITVMCDGAVSIINTSNVSINSVRQISGGYVYNVSITLSTSALTPFTDGYIIFNNDTDKKVNLYGNWMFGTTAEINSGSEGGSYTETIYYYTAGSGIYVEYGLTPPVSDWVRVNQTSAPDNYTTVYSVTVQPNTDSMARAGEIWFKDTLDSSGSQRKFCLVVRQAGAGSDKSISISPTISNVDNLAGRQTITVTPTGIGTSDIQVTSVGSFITVSGQGTSTVYVDYTTNTSTTQRTATVTFSATGVNPVTFTLIQAGRSASFSVVPSSLTFHKEGGSDNLTFFNIPNGGLSWEITYSSGTDWIDTISFNNNVATVLVTENTGSRRNAVIKFYNQDDSDDYIDITVVQNGEGFDSIWFDKAFEPSSFQVGESYHYKLQDHSTNNIIYEGITVPVSDTENPLGINIPRLVDSYIHSNILDDLKEDMILRKLDGSLSVDFYDMNGSTPSLVKTFNYWNDWSGPGYNTVYDITQALNDPINHKGCNYMVIPFCIYDDELSSYTVVETKKDGTQVNYPMGTPLDAFMYAAGEFFNAKSVSFKKGSDTLLTYDMDNCGEGFLLYKNRFGGWDSFLIEGNIYKYDEYTRLNGVYPKYPNGYGYSREKMTDRNTIRTRYEINTGWLTDEQAERLVFHLMSSTTVALRSFSDRTVSSFPYNMLSVSIVDSSAEYKKFKNGKRLINYTITLEENDTKQVQR